MRKLERDDSLFSSGDRHRGLLKPMEVYTKMNDFYKSNCLFFKKYFKRVKREDGFQIMKKNCLIHDITKGVSKER